MSASSKKGKGEGWKEDVVNGKDVDLPKTSTCLQPESITSRLMGAETTVESEEVDLDTSNKWIRNLKATLVRCISSTILSKYVVRPFPYPLRFVCSFAG